MPKFPVFIPLLPKLLPTVFTFWVFEKPPPKLFELGLGWTKPPPPIGVLRELDPGFTNPPPPTELDPKPPVLEPMGLLKPPDPR